MRTFVLSMLIAGSSLLLTGTAQAGGGNHRHHNDSGYHTKGAFHFSLSPHVQNSNKRHCQSNRSRTRTIVLKRCTKRQPYYDGRGRLYHNTETVVTYKTIYRNGSHKIYCRTYPGY